MWYVLRGMLNVDQVAVNRAKRQGFKPVHIAFAIRNCFGWGDDDQVFDADAIVTGLVVPRFVRQDHAGL